MRKIESRRVWTVAEAKARLSEILRLAEEEEPQRIGARRSFILVPEKVWEEKAPPRKPLGQWLVENMPRSVELPIPSCHEKGRPIPFIDEPDE